MAEAWICLKGWYAAAGDRPPKPCHETMAKQTAERVELYERVPLPGEPICINVEPKEVVDACPGNVELRDMVGGYETAAQEERAEFGRRPSREG